MDAARRSKRYPSEHPLLVRCDSWNEFVSLYAGDIGQGGMLIVTDDPPPILSQIDVRLQLPEAVEIALRVRVVHVIETSQVTPETMRAGVGVEFVDLDPERKRQILQLIEFARWQGATGDPNASLARTMLEHSALESQGKKGLPSLPSPATGRRPTGGDDARKITLDGTEKQGATSTAPRSPSSQPSRSTASMPAAARPGGTQAGKSTSSMPAAKLDGPASSRSTASVPAVKPADGSPASDKPVAPPKPSDVAKVKIVVTHFAHKRYDLAIEEAGHMLQSNPGDVQALKWQSMCRARQAIASGDGASAVTHYTKALEHEEGNREASDFLRTYERDKRLNALPFGRYFTGKKK